MQQQLGFLYYTFRFLFASIAVVVCLFLLSAFISATGANSALDTKTTSYAIATENNTYDTPNTITAGAYRLANSTKRVTLITGTVLYDASRSISAITTQCGKTITHVSTVTARRLWGGTISVANGIGNGTMVVLRAPSKIIGAITQGRLVSTVIQPSGNMPVPVIDSATSAAVFERLNAQQRQEIAKLLTNQLAANRGLAGLVVSGDPRHGGYPARWDKAPQDSLVDSWGMYSRECVSYAAWKVYQTYGYMPYWGGVGNANRWIKNARTAGITTGSTPQVGSVAISMRGHYGHAMWVEAVKGNMIYISQYNYDLRGHYSEMWVNSSYFSYIYFK